MQIETCKEKDIFQGIKHFRYNNVKYRVQRNDETYHIYEYQNGAYIHCGQIVRGIYPLAYELALEDYLKEDEDEDDL